MYAESAGARRITALCQAKPRRLLYAHRATGMHYWLHRHGGRILMVELLGGDGFEITSQRLASPEWKLEAHYVCFCEEDAAMGHKVHPDDYNEMPDTEEHFRKGLVERFKWPKRPRMCRFCRTQGLYWFPTERGFKLFNKANQEHTCPGSADMY